MKLVSDWRSIVAISLSFWLQVAGLLVLILPEVRFALTGVDSDPVFLWWLGILLLLAGIVGRLLPQELTGLREWLRLGGVGLVVVLLAFLLASAGSIAPDEAAEPEQASLSAPAIETAEAATLRLAVPFIAKEEGKRNRAYQDVVGVWTICYGHTKTARAGMTKSDAECTALLQEEVAHYRRGLHAYFSEDTKAGRLTPERDTAYTSLAFNVGIRGAGRSTATRRLNAGDIAGGCQALTWWNKAGGRVIRGLVNRRNREHALCMAGV